MDWYSQRPRYADYCLIFVGTCFLALGIQWLYDPAGLVTGGFTGIAILAKTAGRTQMAGGIPLWLTNLVLNAPVFLAAFWMKGIRFAGKTGIAAGLLSLWLFLLPEADLAQGDPLLAAVFGGALSGIGIGLVFLARATTGGTDLAAALIHDRMRHYSVIRIMQLLDAAVVVAGLSVFGLSSGLYAVIAIYVASKVSDGLLEGVKFSKAAFIITQHSGRMAQALMERLNRGVTGIYAKGMYSGDEKCVLYCVVSKKEIVALKDIAAEIDRNAFVIVSDAREVFGEGFMN